MEETNTQVVSENQGLSNTTSTQMTYNNKNTCCQKFKEWRLAHINFYFYIIFVIICSLICIAIQILSYWSFCKTKNEIYSIYNTNTTIETKICRDSVFHREIDGLIAPFCQNIRQKTYFHNIVDKSIAHVIRQIDADSLAKRKIETIQQDTKTLLDMQYHKIEHEFQIMQVWCGILTVVFLIFSFYSLFKADYIVMQGKIVLKELDSIKTRGDEKIKAIDTESKAAIKYYNEKIDATISNIDIRSKGCIEEINNHITSKANELSKYVKEKQTEFETIYQKAEIEWQQKIGELNTRYEILDSQFNLLKQQIDNLKHTSNVNNSKKE